MKTLERNIAKKTVLYLFASFMLLSIPVAAQNNKSKTIDSEYAIENICTGIKSENTGVKKSMIYLAGKYKMTHAVDALTEQLEDEKFPEIKILIALSFYQIGDKDGMEAVKNLAFSASDNRVKNMCSAIYNQYMIDVNIRTAGL